MDIPKEYILMCEKAIEIQKDKVFDEGNFVYCKITNHTYFLHGLESKIAGEYRERYTWLPRQDQLQGMVIGENKKFRNHIHALNFFIDFQHDEEWQEEKTDYLIKYNSMEQLWLAFVMKEKYGKIWNGEDWIKDKE